ncbi:MAG: DUF3048 C-terminal domain-containing protein [Anaerolineae bacterium]|nr:DUF3048 C-terminal domain-containing protein [Anaerolineae bacterium]
MPRLILFLLALVALFTLLVVACNAEPTPTPVPPTRRPTRTPIPPATLKPQPTQAIPTATRLPTQTEEPSPEPTASPAPATPVPASNSGGGGGGLTVWTMAPLIQYFSNLAPSTQEGISRGANVNPLTGLEVSNPAFLQRRPILARIGNDPSAREIHAGFNQADLVFEEMIDQRNMVFAVTRFTLVFYGQDGTFRPLRSARAVNASLLPMLDGILISSGGSKGTRFMLSQLAWKDRNLDGDLQGSTICIAPGDYRVRVASTVQHVHDYLASKGITGSPNLRGFQFSGSAPNGAPANVIAFDHGPWPLRATGVIEWRYDAASGKYLRFVNGAPHNTQSYPLDGKWNGACAIGAPQTEQIASSNVIVLNVKYEPTDFVEDTLNSYSAFVEMTGAGAAQIYRDGVKQDVTWSRPTLTDFFKFTDASGAEVPLKPGNTWFELAPLGYSPTIK